jgi:hypothetical protein
MPPDAPEPRLIEVATSLPAYSTANRIDNANAPVRTAGSAMSPDRITWMVA